MRWQCDGNNNAMATMGSGSLAAAWRRRWWLRDRTTAVTAEAWRWQIGGGAKATAVVVVAPAAWRHQRWQLDNKDVFPDDNLYRQWCCACYSASLVYASSSCLPNGSKVVLRYRNPRVLTSLAVCPNRGRGGGDPTTAAATAGPPAILTAPVMRCCATETG